MLIAKLLQKCGELEAEGIDCASVRADLEAAAELSARARPESSPLSRDERDAAIAQEQQLVARAREKLEGAGA